MQYLKYPKFLQYRKSCNSRNFLHASSSCNISGSRSISGTAVLETAAVFEIAQAYTSFFLEHSNSWSTSSSCSILNSCSIWNSFVWNSSSTSWIPAVFQVLAVFVIHCSISKAYSTPNACRYLTSHFNFLQYRNFVQFLKNLKYSQTPGTAPALKP